MKNNNSLDIKFSAIFKQHYPKIVFYARKYVRDEETAKEIVQDVFTSLWENMNRIEGDALPYLFVLTKRRCLNLIRHQKYRTEHKDFVTKAYYSTEINYSSLKESTIENLLSEEANKVFLKTINSLPEKTKEAFLLNRFSDMTYRQIATKQSVTVKNIEFRMMTALRVLRENLSEFSLILIGIFLS